MTSDIPLYLWESFIAVVEEKTLQRAAIKLKTTQPTITRHLHQLEEALPLKLFELRGRTKVPTSFAEDLYQKINLRLRFLPEDIRQSLQSSAQTGVSLRLEGDLNFLSSFFVSNKFPGKLSLSHLSEMSLRQKLTEERFDLVVSSEDILNPRYLKKKLTSEKFVLCVPKKFCKNGKLTVDWLQSSAKKYPLALRSEEAFQREFLKSDFVLDFETMNWEMLEARVEAGMNWSVLPKSQLRPKAGYLTVPLALKKSSPLLQERFLYYRQDLIRFAWFKSYLQALLNFDH